MDYSATYEQNQAWLIITIYIVCAFIVLIYILQLIYNYNTTP